METHKIEDSAPGAGGLLPGSCMWQEDHREVSTGRSGC